MTYAPACLRTLRMMALALILAAGILATGAAPAFAQGAAPAEPSTGTLTSLLHTLQTPQQRQALIADLQALIAARGAPAAPAPAAPQGIGGRLVAVLSNQADRIGASVTALAHLAPRADFADWATALRTEPQLRAVWVMGVASVAGVLGAAWLAMWIARAVLGPVRRRVQGLAPGPVWARVFGAALAILLDCLPALALLAAGYAVLAVLQAAGDVAHPARVAVLAALDAVAVVRIIMAVALALLLPGAAGVRFLPVDEANADYALVWISRFSRFAVYGAFGLAAALECGLNLAVYQGLIRAFGLAMAGLLTMLILQNRIAVARVIRGQARVRTGGFARMRGRIAEFWHIAAILYLFGAYVVWAVNIPGGFAFLLRASILSLLILAAARVADGAGRAGMARFLTVGPELEQRLPGLQLRADRYAPVVTGAARLMLFALATLLVLQAWGLSGFDWLATAPGQRVIGGLVTIAVMAVVSVGLWEVLALAAEFYVTRPGVDGTRLERSARIRTLLPLFRKTLAIVLGLGFVLIALATVGVNIAPLLAGAGIAGIAVGFGAQSLVKDVITGVFVLMQDAVSVGDVVTVAGQTGLVEQISIRSIRLRNLSGTVIIIPFSEVTTVQNMTKDFSYAMFNIGVAYREDIDQVITVIVALAAEMQADAEFGWRILEPIQILGLDQFADSAVIVKARIKTKPIQQWNVMRGFNLRMKRRFDELNIEMPFPHQTIYFGEDRQGNAPAAHVEFSGAGIVPDDAKRAPEAA